MFVDTLHKEMTTTMMMMMIMMMIIIIIIIIINVSNIPGNHDDVSDISGNHDVKELQKTAILGTAHILREVLT